MTRRIGSLVLQFRCFFNNVYCNIKSKPTQFTPQDHMIDLFLWCFQVQHQIRYNQQSIWSVFIVAQRWSGDPTLLFLLNSSFSSSSPQAANMMRKDVNKPKGKTSAYAFFVQTCREEHRKKNPEQSVNFAEFSKKCSERWKVRLSGGQRTVLEGQRRGLAPFLSGHPVGGQ
ncbi:hypothetical protein CHARACLAT_033621 [Characodon lateralis]|uniref:HMG box domain-containing protein n=1 Tax=Characodon lateralis TaxID=208331 RepID=A0ABU7DP20_9TELE|nr:hypothetical protein [Characodon lateralis]